MPKPPLIYTIEVDGKPTLTFAAGHAREAAELCKEAWLRSDLTELTSNGVPLCLPASTLTSRIANEGEVATYREAAKEAKASDEILFAYLVELDGMPE
ncbi:hypothetical protein JQ609_32445 [Bradyrhizobium sp. AUGA SZCCT0169]|uniref:hypothetical protein n=1 Tax=unclassified Bradyrhizobium TaxID=2631580 RepID=UPI001BADB4B8|nr:MULTISPECIES: hypothetical protein [unclassified Bradyrhizobium]MBR1194086.1 hypothetical protein [Bradyrhizobium sp. AUGA SZCCT0160]MBR1251613.1 hypothetical protein [Bradyrhizobium sp. AUGA SZCCT0169]